MLGHSLLINKDFIEMLALLVVAATRAGRWGGLDIFVRRWIMRPIFSRKPATNASESHGSEDNKSRPRPPASTAATSSSAAWPRAWWSAAGWGRSTSATTRPSASPLRVGVIGTGDEGSVLDRRDQSRVHRSQVDRRHPPVQHLAGLPRRPLQRRGPGRPAGLDGEVRLEDRAGSPAARQGLRGNRTAATRNC